MPLLKISRWDELYETAESRKIKNGLAWVRLPTDHGGKAFRRLMRHPEAAKILAGWILMLEVAAKCKPRGVLIDDKQKPLDADDLEDLTGLPAGDFRLAIEVLTNPRILWVEAENGDPRRFGKSPGDSGKSSGDRIESSEDMAKSSGDSQQTNIRGEDKALAALTRPPASGGERPKPKKKTPPKKPAEDPPGFVSFWKRYPRKIKRSRALKAWGTRGLEDTKLDVLTGLRRWTDFWTASGTEPRYIPHPTTWLNDEGWTDHPDEGEGGSARRISSPIMAAAQETVDDSLPTLGDVADAQDADEAAKLAASRHPSLYPPE